MPPLYDDDALAPYNVYIWTDKETCTEYCVFAKRLLEAGFILNKHIDKDLAAKLIKTPPQVKSMPDLMIIDDSQTKWFT